MPDSEYNPLDYANLTRSVVRELMNRGPFPLPPPSAFTGTGVYALFYLGDFQPYEPLRSLDATRPIYVGKAVPPGARKGGGATLGSPSTALYSRLRQHAKSIGGVENLNPAEFRCRYLVVTPLWITMAERFLIENFRPLWNTCIEGFGIHDPGSGRHAGEISWWDVLHPGRPFAVNLARTRAYQDALNRLDHCLRGHEVPHDIVEAEQGEDEDMDIASTTLEEDAST